MNLREEVLRGVVWEGFLMGLGGLVGGVFFWVGVNGVGGYVLRFWYRQSLGNRVSVDFVWVANRLGYSVEPSNQ